MPGHRALQTRRQAEKTTEGASVCCRDEIHRVSDLPSIAHPAIADWTHTQLRWSGDVH
ncbi:hypothetical protein Acsp02_64000 [Actinoplanes sp. NBRC 103695]|nr:hypothetical protein Acsp02_64000 [Actinoplanes sp. NBRC 103695]